MAGLIFLWQGGVAPPPPPPPTKYDKTYALAGGEKTYADGGAKTYALAGGDKTYDP